MNPPTSFPGFLFFPCPGARERDGNKRDPGNEAVNPQLPSTRSARKTGSPRLGLRIVILLVILEILLHCISLATRLH